MKKLQSEVKSFDFSYSDWFGKQITDVDLGFFCENKNHQQDIKLSAYRQQMGAYLNTESSLSLATRIKSNVLAFAYIFHRKFPHLGLSIKSKISSSWKIMIWSSSKKPFLQLPIHPRHLLCSCRSQNAPLLSLHTHHLRFGDWKRNKFLIKNDHGEFVLIPGSDNQTLLFLPAAVYIIYPILIRVYPRKRGWPDLPHSNSNLSNSHSPSRSIQGFLLL